MPERQKPPDYFGDISLTKAIFRKYFWFRWDRYWNHTASPINSAALTLMLFFLAIRRNTCVLGMCVSVEPGVLGVPASSSQSDLPV